MPRRFILPTCLAAFVAFLVAGMALPTANAEEKLPSKSDQSCLKCHNYDKQADVLAGKLKDVSVKANAIQIQIDNGMDVVLFDDSTLLKNAPSMAEIPKGESIKITYFKKNGKTFAKEVEVKKGINVPENQLMSTEEVKKLVAKGPKEGNYILLDSRPPNMYNDGHIPTAVSMPFGAFDKLADKLLKDKETTQIYYCAGLS